MKVGRRELADAGEYGYRSDAEHEFGQLLSELDRWRCDGTE